MSEVHELPQLLEERERGAKCYHEFLRVPAMSAGVYVLQPGAADLQEPHKEAEIYYVIRGRAQMLLGTEDRVVTSGSVIFVDPEKRHSFHDIEEELVLLVIFAPPES